MCAEHNRYMRDYLLNEYKITCFKTAKSMLLINFLGQQSFLAIYLLFYPYHRTFFIVLIGRKREKQRNINVGDKDQLAAS